METSEVQPRRGRYREKAGEHLVAKVSRHLTSSWFSRTVIFPTVNGDWRVYIDYWNLNKPLKTDSGGLGDETAMHDRTRTASCLPSWTSLKPTTSCPSRNSSGTRQRSETPLEGCTGSMVTGLLYRRFRQCLQLSWESPFDQCQVRGVWRSG